MEQHLRLYRNHTPVCGFGYKKPVFEEDISPSRPDCTCPINAEGKLFGVLNPDGSPKRIRHRTLGKTNLPCKDWKEAHTIRDQWLSWGGFESPSATLEGPNVTVRQAVEYFVKFHADAETKSAATQGKYDVLFFKRLLPWCDKNRKHMMKDFDGPVAVKNFYSSWRNLQPERGKALVFDSKVPLARNTKVHELERFRTFLEFCRNNKWIETNYAKRPHIKLSAPKPQPKYGFSADEWDNIKTTLSRWKDRYFKTQPEKKDRRRTFVHALRFTGQRLSDTTMMGPHSIVEDEGKFFIALTQIKTGSFVKIPVTVELVNMLRALPIMGETQSPVVLVRREWTITYGTQFWFWSAPIPERATAEQLNQIVESAAKNWSDDITVVLNRVEKEHGNFEHHSTPHSFRHYFAISMLNAGVALERVAKWLGDTPKTVNTHYSHANSDWHEQSHADYMKALKTMDSRREQKKRKVVSISKAG